MARTEPHTEGAGRAQCLASGPHPPWPGRPQGHHLGGDPGPRLRRSAVDRIPHDEPSVRRLVGRLGNPRLLRACHQAGPTGFELARLLMGMHVRCEVIAPSLIPKAPGDKARDRPAGLPPADGSTLLAHGVSPWERLACLSLED